MDIFRDISDRRSIRKYKDGPVEKESIEQVLDAAGLAPSWKNMQQEPKPSPRKELAETAFFENWGARC